MSINEPINALEAIAYRLGLNQEMNRRDVSELSKDLRGIVAFLRASEASTTFKSLEVTQLAPRFERVAGDIIVSSSEFPDPISIPLTITIQVNPKEETK